MSEQMKPCPFCGSSPKMCSFGPAYWVKCTNERCNAQLLFETTEVAAIAAWNQRAGEAELAKSHQDYAELSERVEQFRAEAEDVAEKREAELAALRAEKNEAIGAALAVEQRCYDQAQELARLRANVETLAKLAYGHGLISDERATQLTGLSLPDIMHRVQSGEWPEQGEMAEAELAALRALREAVIGLGIMRMCGLADDDTPYWTMTKGVRSTLLDVAAALAACDEASAPTET